MYTGGYMGKILRVNLSSQSVTEENLEYEMAKNFIGGTGFGIKYLFEEVPMEADPLGEENKLIFSTGPLTGSNAPCASRMAVTAKSPLTGAIGMALSGGYFPAELKFSGYDVLIIEGKSERPVYLLINENGVKLKSAKAIWGTSTLDCQFLIKNEIHDQKARIACIGPAGENLSRLACIINERRAAGRKGLGAVMGSKNLKAIAVRGKQKVKIASKEKFKTARSSMLKLLKESPILYPHFSKLGTTPGVDNCWGLGILPSKNWSATGEFAPVDAIGVKANQELKIGSERCFGCPVGCSQQRLVKKGKYAGALSDPEFETLYAFGAATGVDNLESIIAADRLCDELGLDTISTGLTISFAMELYEKELLSLEDTDGMELNFGNHEAMVDLVQKMAFQEGIGALLSHGSKYAAQKIGKGTEKYAMHVKGLEMPGYDVRGSKAQGLGYATSYTGGDHNRGYAFQEIFGIPVPEPVDRLTTDRKAMITRWNQDLRMATCDLPLMCAFLLDTALTGNAPQNTADLLTGITGISYTQEEVLEAGERVNTLARAANLLAGFRREDDTLPERLLTEPLKDGSAKGHFISEDELNTMLDEYYSIRGWSDKGVPTRDKLMSIGLKNVSESLEKAGFYGDDNG